MKLYKAYIFKENSLKQKSIDSVDLFYTFNKILICTLTQTKIIMGGGWVGWRAKFRITSMQPRNFTTMFMLSAF